MVIYDMYSVEHLQIIKKLSRKEIIDTIINLSQWQDHRIIRFIQGFKLTPQEVELFKTTFAKSYSIINAIHYYQDRNLEVYNKNNLVKTRKKDI